MNDNDYQFNIVLKKVIYLEKGEIWCPCCYGAGGFYYYGFTTNKRLICARCCGLGKIDWVENITGEKHDPERIFREFEHKNE